MSLSDQQQSSADPPPSQISTRPSPSTSTEAIRTANPQITVRHLGIVHNGMLHQDNDQEGELRNIKPEVLDEADMETNNSEGLDQPPNLGFPQAQDQDLLNHVLRDNQIVLPGQQQPSTSQPLMPGHSGESSTVKTETFDFDNEANKIIMKTEAQDEQKFDPSQYQFFSEEEEDDDEVEECDCPDCLVEEVQIIDDDDDDDDVQFLPERPQEGQGALQQPLLNIPPAQQGQSNAERSLRPRDQRRHNVTRQQVFRCTYIIGANGLKCDYHGTGYASLILHIRKRHFGVPETLKGQEQTGNREPEKPDKYIAREFVEVVKQQLTDFQADQLEAAYLSSLSAQMDGSQVRSFYENLAFNLKLNSARVVTWFNNRRRKQKLAANSSGGAVPVDSRCKRRKVKNRRLAQSVSVAPVAGQSSTEPQPSCSTWNENGRAPTSGSNAPTQAQLPPPPSSTNSGSSYAAEISAQSPHQPLPTNSGSNSAAVPSTLTSDQPPPKPKCIRAQALEAAKAITSHCRDSLRIKQENVTEEQETIHRSNPQSEQLQPQPEPSSTDRPTVAEAEEVLEGVQPMKLCKSIIEKIQIEINKHSGNSVCLSEERQPLNRDSINNNHLSQQSSGTAASNSRSSVSSAGCLTAAARRRVGDSGNPPPRIVCLNARANVQPTVPPAAASSVTQNSNSATNEPPVSSPACSRNLSSTSSHATPQPVEAAPISPATSSSPPVAVRPSSQALVQPNPKKFFRIMELIQNSLSQNACSSHQSTQQQSQAIRPNFVPCTESLALKNGLDHGDISDKPKPPEVSYSLRCAYEEMISQKASAQKQHDLIKQEHEEEEMEVQIQEIERMISENSSVSIISQAPSSSNNLSSTSTTVTVTSSTVTSSNGGKRPRLPLDADSVSSIMDNSVSPIQSLSISSTSPPPVVGQSVSNVQTESALNARQIEQNSSGVSTGDDSRVIPPPSKIPRVTVQQSPPSLSFPNGVATPSSIFPSSPPPMVGLSVSSNNVRTESNLNAIHIGPNSSANSRVNPPPSKVPRVMPQHESQSTSNEAAGSTSCQIVNGNQSTERSQAKSNPSTTSAQSTEAGSGGQQHSSKSRLFSNFDPKNSAIALTGTSSVAARKPPPLVVQRSHSSDPLATNSSNTPQLSRQSSLCNSSSSSTLSESRGRGDPSPTRNGNDDDINRRNRENAKKQNKQQEHSVRRQSDFYANLFSDPNSNGDTNKGKSAGSSRSNDRPREFTSSSSKSREPKDRSSNSNEKRHDTSYSSSSSSRNSPRHDSRSSYSNHHHNNRNSTSTDRGKPYPSASSNSESVSTAATSVSYSSKYTTYSHGVSNSKNISANQLRTPALAAGSASATITSQVFHQRPSVPALPLQHTRPSLPPSAAVVQNNQQLSPGTNRPSLQTSPPDLMFPNSNLTNSVSMLDPRLNTGINRQPQQQQLGASSRDPRISNYNNVSNIQNSVSRVDPRLNSGSNRLPMQQQLAASARDPRVSSGNLSNIQNSTNSAPLNILYNRLPHSFPLTTPLGGGRPVPFNPLAPSSNQMTGGGASTGGSNHLFIGRAELEISKTLDIDRTSKQTTTEPLSPPSTTTTEEIEVERVQEKEGSLSASEILFDQIIDDELLSSGSSFGDADTVEQMKELVEVEKNEAKKDTKDISQPIEQEPVSSDESTYEVIDSYITKGKDTEKAQEKSASSSLTPVESTPSSSFSSPPVELLTERDDTSSEPQEPKNQPELKNQIVSEQADFDIMINNEEEESNESSSQEMSQEEGSVQMGEDDDDEEEEDEGYEIVDEVIVVDVKQEENNENESEIIQVKTEPADDDDDDNGELDDNDDSASNGEIEENDANINDIVSSSSEGMSQGGDRMNIGENQQKQSKEIEPLEYQKTVRTQEKEVVLSFVMCAQLDVEPMPEFSQDLDMLKTGSLIGTEDFGVKEATKSIEGIVAPKTKSSIDNACSSLSEEKPMLATLTSVLSNGGEDAAAQIDSKEGINSILLLDAELFTNRDVKSEIDGLMKMETKSEDDDKDSNLLTNTPLVKRSCSQEADDEQNEAESREQKRIKVDSCENNISETAATTPESSTAISIDCNSFYANAATSQVQPQVESSTGEAMSERKRSLRERTTNTPPNTSQQAQEVVNALASSSEPNVRKTRPTPSRLSTSAASTTSPGPVLRSSILSPSRGNSIATSRTVRKVVAQKQQEQQGQQNQAKPPAAARPSTSNGGNKREYVREYFRAYNQQKKDAENNGNQTNTVRMSLRARSAGAQNSSSSSKAPTAISKRNTSL